MTDVQIVTSPNPNVELGVLVKDIRESMAKMEKEKITYGELETKIDKMEKDLNSAHGKVSELETKTAKQEKIIDSLERAQGSKQVIATAGIPALNPELQSVYEKAFATRNLKMALNTDDTMKKYYAMTEGDGSVTIPKINKISGQYEQRDLKYVRSDVADAGGLLVPPEFMPELIRNLTEISPVRKYARAMTTYSNILQLPLRNVLLTSSWGYEGQDPLNKSQSQYNRPEIHMKRLSVSVPITIEELMDSPIDMQAEIANDVNEEFAQREGYGFIKGNGTNQVEGLMSDTTGISSINSGSGTNVTADAILQMFGEIKWESYGNQNYDRIYTFNRRTWIKILQLKDGVGRYIWAQGNIAAGIPNSVLGAQYFISPDMDDISAGTYPILMGDFKQGYVVADRMLMYMVRDEVTKPGYIIFTFIRRLGAMVVKKEAFVKMKVSA
jgi:HK97 family phage major capsid protein